MDDIKRNKDKMRFGKEKDPEQKEKDGFAESNSTISEQLHVSREKKLNKEGKTGTISKNSEVVNKEEPEIKKEGLKRLLEEKEEKLRQEHDRLLRTQAEYENYKKRMARERANLLKFGNESLIKELLPIIDNLERSLEHANNAETIDTIIDGIEMIKKEFLKKLEKFGLKTISAKGEKFDPLKHEAKSQIETSEYPEGTIAEELQKGYFIYDRLLRPAMVVVAKPPHPPQSDSPIPHKSI